MSLKGYNKVIHVVTVLLRPTYVQKSQKCTKFITFFRYVCLQIRKITPWYHFFEFLDLISLLSKNIVNLLQKYIICISFLYNYCQTRTTQINKFVLDILNLVTFQLFQRIHKFPQPCLHVLRSVSELTSLSTF